MIRTGFVFPAHGESWLGGANYLRNLLTALAAAPDLGVQPVLLAGSGARLPLGFEDIELVRTLSLSVHQALDARGLFRLLGREPLLDRILLRRRLDLLSHSGVLGQRARTPSMPWLFDVQHRHFPEFFNSRDLALRDELFSRSLREGALVLVSSEAARMDVDHYFPGFADKLRVLRFVDGAAAAVQGTSRAALEQKYSFQGRYLALPNQYWVHKNHALVLEALALLQSRGRKVLVLSTGSPTDYRRPGHFDRLMQRRAESGLEENYRVLGVVPFADLAGLLRHATAILNPSLFEGWSSSVEEAKSLGKRVVLSDLPVHREQAPERALWFDPKSAEQLAEAIWTAWVADDAAAGDAAAVRATLALPGRRRRFAEEYAAIAHEAIARAPPRR